MNKEKLRKKILNKRNNISNRFCIVNSNKIFNNFKINIFPSLKKGKIIIYNSFKNEVKTEKIIDFLLNKGFEIYNPCIIDKKIIPCKFFSHKKLSIGPYKIMEPVKKYKLKTMKNVIAVIVPGIVFDKNGNRIGFGKGYFDRFLCKINKNILKIALAYSFQVLKKIPYTKKDVKMDIIITEKEIIYVKKKKKNL
ncbi:MAG: 5-formyltetrahydrofolate cyclo-ligase [Candidatus Goldbacteria bacterium]|nr:5-formyltetrahydrofolate cyclo-ligase [Candidatus Goldiibacteriota bacterium]